jgi:hypothetical protein
MIILTPKTVEWTSEDAARLKDFLNSPTGSRVLQFLAMGSPDLLDGAHKNKTLVASGALAGYQDAINTIFKLTYENPNAPVVPDVVSENYKSLDDDSAWVEEDKTVDKSKNPTTS